MNFIEKIFNIKKLMLCVKCNECGKEICGTSEKQCALNFKRHLKTHEVKVENTEEEIKNDN